mgnify:CR=1 FL=1
MAARVEGHEVDTRHWIPGRRVDSDGRFRSISPIDETVIAEVSAVSAAEIRRAVFPELYEEVEA